nr:AMP-binding protein [Burkholderia pseudomallei]
MDPAYPRERIAYMLRDSAPIAVLTSRASRDLVASHLPDRAPLVVIDAAACPWDALSGDDLDPNDIELNATHLCYVIYTSGSTGQPKGVMIEHRNLVNYTLDAIRWFGLGPGETVLQQNSLNFDLSLEEIVPALSSGAALAPAVELFGAGDCARAFGLADDDPSDGRAQAATGRRVASRRRASGGGARRRAARQRDGRCVVAA